MYFKHDCIESSSARINHCTWCWLELASATATWWKIFSLKLTFSFFNIKRNQCILFQKLNKWIFDFSLISEKLDDILFSYSKLILSPMLWKLGLSLHQSCHVCSLQNLLELKQLPGLLSLNIIVEISWGSIAACQLAVLSRGWWG